MSVISTESLYAPLRPSTMHNDAHFLRAVAAMAEQQEVVAINDILAESGAKLVNAGDRIAGSFYERLSQHRLAAAIDEQLQCANVVDIRTLEAQVHLLSGSTALGRLLQRAMGDKHYLLLETLRHMKWPTYASFKMTVMRYQLPDLFEHSLLMMMCAVYLGVKEKLSLDDCSELAAAALLHDVGMLYMPPNWRDANYKLSTEERKQLAAHSITAMLVLRSVNAYTVRAEDAVMQHHERSDGSGYPRHLRGNEISHWGHIFMLAEVVSAFFEKFADIPVQRLSLMLRMNHNRFDAQLTQHVYALLACDSVGDEGGSEVSHTRAEVRQVVATLAAVMQHWAMCQRRLPDKWQALPNGRACAYVGMRMQTLEKTLAESGSHPRQQADWLKMFEEDPSSMAELVMINKEALWQVESCVQTCTRRWPQVLQPVDELDVVLSDWLKNCLGVLGGESVSKP